MDLALIGAHPDDVELFAGGLIANATRLGREVGVIHLTRGERGTRGEPEERRDEAFDAAAILGVSREHVRILDLGDTLLENTESNRLELIRVLREWRPRIVLHHHPNDRHPDHRKAQRLAEDAYFYCRLPKIETGQEPHRPAWRFAFYNSSAPRELPSFIADVSDVFDTKMESLHAYRSQVYNPDYPAPETYVSSREYYEQIEIRARYFGGLIGARYGEPFQGGPLPINDLAGLMGDFRPD